MDRQKKIVKMFDEIAKSYDLANRVLSFGSDVVWRKRACAKSLKLYNKDIDLIADIACGTGDMLGFWQKAAKKEGIDVKRYLGIDPSVGMLEVAREKFKDFEFIEGYAQNLPLEDESVDILSITYGIRNVVDIKEAIEEFSRVLKPGGILVILEFTRRDKRNFIDSMVEFYMKRVLPFVGGLLSGNKEAYEYLPNSIDGFLTTGELEKEIKEAKMDIVEINSYSFGISTTFIARKNG